MKPNTTIKPVIGKLYRVTNTELGIEWTAPQHEMILHRSEDGRTATEIMKLPATGITMKSITLGVGEFIQKYLKVDEIPIQRITQADKSIRLKITASHLQTLQRSQAMATLCYVAAGLERSVEVGADLTELLLAKDFPLGMSPVHWAFAYGHAQFKQIIPAPFTKVRNTFGLSAGDLAKLNFPDATEHFS